MEMWVEGNTESISVILNVVQGFCNFVRTADLKSLFVRVLLVQNYFLDRCPSIEFVKLIYFYGLDQVLQLKVLIRFSQSNE